MNGGPTQHRDVAPPGERALADLSNVTALAVERAEPTSSAPPISVTNVVPFVRPRREATATGATADIALDPAARPAPPLIGRKGRVQILALLALSLAVHSGLYVLFNREPEPMASIALESISVEIMLGDNRPVAAHIPGQPEVQRAQADDPKPTTLDPDTVTAKVEEARPVAATPVKPQQLAQTAVTEVTPDRPRSVLAERPPEPLRQQEVSVL